MKWKRYFFNGIWHLHTNYTDGENSVFEYCDVAKEMGIKLVCFTEHVSLDLSYNFNNYLLDIKKARKRCNMTIACMHAQNTNTCFCGPFGQSFSRLF